MPSDEGQGKAFLLGEKGRGRNSFVKRIAFNSVRSQGTPVFFLFAVVILVLLFYPLGRPWTMLQRGFYPQFAMDLAVWMVLIAGSAWLWQIAHSSSKNLPRVFTRYILFLFTLFFAVERLAAALFSGGLLHSPWAQALSCALASAVAIVSLPRLRSIRESADLAQMEHARFLAAMESSLDDFYIFDGVPDASGTIVDFRFSYINPNAERRLQVRRESLIGKILTEVRPFMVTSGLIEKYRDVVRTGEPYTCEIFLDDERIKDTWLNVQVVRLGDGIAITSRDVTERKRLADHVQYLAHYDQLTGLANRTLLQDRLYQAIVRARRYKHKVALFVLDVDHFKQINDSLGHAEGDALLLVVGERLAASVRETDTVARMGGDEFVIVMPDFKNLEDVRRCGIEIVTKAAKPVHLNGRDVNVTVSVGVSIFPDNADGEKDLFKNADEAMYAVKESGRDGLHFFGEDLKQERLMQVKQTQDEVS
ncbi:MAG TPA: diguanylate cyclase [Edaphobacter sp.]|jgi:diguanylate cyclase (GGDEF)-like protein